MTTQDWTRDELECILQQAHGFKKGDHGPTMEGKSIALLFFNPSLRTRTSFELGAHQLGGKAIVLNPGKDAWPVEFETGAVMDGDPEEHIAEVAAVLSRYCDLIAVRAFPLFRDWVSDRQDIVLKTLAQYATVPVINMETIVHPCQELALIMTIQEKLKTVEKPRFLLTWTYHPRPLNSAVANSALLIASKFGMDVTLLCPNEDYLLDPHFVAAAKRNATEQGGSMKISHSIDQSYEDADFVYAKSWGSLNYFGNWEREKPMRDQFKHFMVDEEKMCLTNNALFSHCLPLRRNVKATDGVMDADYCVAIDEAENRLHVQKSIMTTLLNQPLEHPSS